jgi:hypothetical protein
MRAGIPTALITVLESVARVVSAKRIMQRKAVVALVGDHHLPLNEKREFRRSLVDKALDRLRNEAW